MKNLILCVTSLFQYRSLTTYKRQHAFTVVRSKTFYAWWVPTPKCGKRQRQTGIARTGVCHWCEEILLRRRRDGGRQRHIEADAEKCERVSVRLVMTRSWLRRAGEAAALALTHLIPTGPPGWRHSACAVAFLCFNFFVSISHTWAFLTSERLCAFVYVYSIYLSIFIFICLSVYLCSNLFIYLSLWTQSFVCCAVLCLTTSVEQRCDSLRFKQKRVTLYTLSILNH